MKHLTWQGQMLWHNVNSTPFLAGWVGFNDDPELPWYARTSGSLRSDPIREEFATEEEARNFLMLIASTQETK